MWSKETIGYVAPVTETNEMYIATVMVQKWLDAGYSERDIAQIWNTGRAGNCIQGVNKHNVSYDSCHYEQKVLAYFSE